LIQIENQKFILRRSADCSADSSSEIDRHTYCDCNTIYSRLHAAIVQHVFYTS